MKRLAAFCLLLAAASLHAETLKFQVTGLDCASCAPPVLRALKAVPGVTNASLDWKSGSATVESKGPVDRAAVRTALDNAGFGAVLPGETGAAMQPLPAAELAKLDIVTQRDGKSFSIDKLTVPGKVTIVDFYGEWCGPCRVLDVRLQHYVAAHPGIAIRRIDIGKWDNAAARQVTHDFRAGELPYIRVYDRNGKFSTAVTGGMWDEVTAAMEKGSR